MEYGLIENALDSLREALTYYHEGDAAENATKYKFSILLSAHCAELLIKEILRRNHPVGRSAAINKGAKIIIQNRIGVIE